MSFKPIRKKSRSVKALKKLGPSGSKYAKLSIGHGWGTKKFDWSNFFTTRTFKALAVLVLIIGGFAALYPTSLFHNYVPSQESQCTFVNAGQCPHDPFTNIWSASAPNNNLAEWNTNGHFFYSSQNGNGMVSDGSANTAVAISRSAIDLSTWSAKTGRISWNYEVPIAQSTDIISQDNCSSCNSNSITFSTTVERELGIVFVGIYETSATFATITLGASAWVLRNNITGVSGGFRYETLEYYFSFTTKINGGVLSTSSSATIGRLGTMLYTIVNYNQASPFDPSGPGGIAGTAQNPSAGYTTSGNGHDVLLGSLTSSGITCDSVGAGFTRDFGVDPCGQHRIITTGGSFTLIFNRGSSAFGALATDAIQGYVCCTQSATLGLFLTTNSAPSSVSNYNPRADPNVLWDNEVSPFSTNWVAESLALQKLGQTNETISSEDTGTCTTSGSCFLKQTTNLAGPDTHKTSILNYLNYSAGVGNNGNVCTTVGIFVGSGCSWLCLTDDVHPLCDDIGGYDNTIFTQTLPYFKFQSQQLYIGFYVRFDVNAGVELLLQNGFPISIDTYTLCPAGGCTPSPNLDTGGFFGPVIKALINLGIYILNGVLYFVNFIVPALTAALIVLEGVIQSTLNSLGNSIGWGNIGDSLINFLNSIPALLANATVALAWVPTIISRMGDMISLLQNLVGSNYWFQGVLNFLNDAKNSVTFIVSIGTSFAKAYPSSYIGVEIVLWFWLCLEGGISGMGTWFRLSKWFAFSVFGLLARVLNVFINIIAFIMGKIPIPFIQFLGGHALELPIVSAGEFPDLSWINLGSPMKAARNYDPFAFLGVIIGSVFTWMWFTSSFSPMANSLYGTSYTKYSVFNGFMLIWVTLAGMIMVPMVLFFMANRLMESGLFTEAKTKTRRFIPTTKYQVDEAENETEHYAINAKGKRIQI